MFTTRSAPVSHASWRSSRLASCLAGEPAFTLVARQYHERVFEFDGAVFLHGNLVAPVRLVAADRRRLRCRRRRHRRPARSGAARRVADARHDRGLALPAIVAHGLLRSGHHAADGGAGAHRRRRPALLPHHRQRARPWARIPRAAATGSPSRSTGRARSTVRCIRSCCRSVHASEERPTSTTR